MVRVFCTKRSAMVRVFCTKRPAMVGGLTFISSKMGVATHCKTYHFRNAFSNYRGTYHLKNHNEPLFPPDGTDNPTGLD
jgi:hypothetical protein